MTWCRDGMSTLTLAHNKSRRRIVSPLLPTNNTTSRQHHPALMARQRNAPATQAEALPTTTRRTRAALKEKTNTTRPTAYTYEDGGKTEEFVKAKMRKGRAKKAASPEKTYNMRGALGSSDIQEKEAPAQSDAPASTDPLARMTSDAAPSTDPLARSEEVEVPPVKGGGSRPVRTKRKIAQSEAQTKMFAGMRQRMQATARGETSREDVVAVAVPLKEPASDTPRTATKTAQRTSATTTHERSDFSLSPTPPPPAGKHSAVKGGRSSLAPGSALRPHGTPAIDTSILKNFQRRPRQQSMLQMVKQRTSIAAQPQSHMQNDDSVYGFEDLEDDIEDEFTPEAEGTPLRAAKTRRQSSAVKKAAPRSAQKPTPRTETVSKKRKSDEIRSSTSALDALHAKRRKSAAPVEDELIVEDSQKEKPADHSPDLMQDATPEVQATSNVQVVGSSPIPSSPLTEPSPAHDDPANDNEDAVVPSTEEQQVEVQTASSDIDDAGLPRADLNDGPPNDTMADPASSSPLLEDLPPAATQRTDVFADPMTQRSPSPPRELRKKAEPKPLTTAKLQALLPKRRAKREPARRRTEFDLPSGSEDEGEEESEPETRNRRQTKAGAKKAGKTSKAALKTKSKARTSKAPASTRKSVAPPIIQRPGSKRTYGRQPVADKENRPEDAGSSGEDEDTSILSDTTLSSTEVSKSAELEAARKKFAEIDQWDMDFESLGGEDHRSSSQGWR